MSSDFIYLIIIIALCGAIGVMVKMYHNIIIKYDDALDVIDELKEEREPSPELISSQKILYRNDYQSRKLYKMLFEILLDLFNEEDDGVAVCRLIEIRDKIVNMDTSNSKYVRKSYDLVVNHRDRTINSIMYWLCSVMDVRGGKESLSEEAKSKYMIYKNEIVTLQKQLLDLNEIMTQQQEKERIEESEEYYEDDEYIDYEPIKSPGEFISNLFKR